MYRLPFLLWYPFYIHRLQAGRKAVVGAVLALGSKHPYPELESVCNYGLRAIRENLVLAITKRPLLSICNEKGLI
jgi:hypothetical protein